MHRFLLRISEVLFQRIKIESDSRGISVNDMIIRILEEGLLNIYKEEGKYGEVKYKQINSKWYSELWNG